MMIEDPRKTRSRAALIGAVTTLLDGALIPSVTDIVAVAGVSRPTFYQHFGDLATAYAEAAVERVQQQLDQMVTIDAGALLDRAQLDRTVAGLVAHLNDHSVFYRAVLRESGSRKLGDRVVAFIAHRIIKVSPLGAPFRESGDEATQDQIVALAAGLFWLITRWLEDETPQSVERMAARIVAVLMSLTPRSVNL